MNKRHVGWDTVDRQVKKLITAVHNSDWKPDLIVGVVRGGTIPAVWMSNITGIESQMICSELQRQQDKESLPTCALPQEDRATRISKH